MKATHTPGPSAYRKTHAAYGLPKPGFRLTACADMDGTHYLREVQEDGTDTPIAVILDNDRAALSGPLLAAAPELLGVAQRIAAEVDGLDMPAQLWDDLHAAIAKATP